MAQLKLIRQDTLFLHNQISVAYSVNPVFYDNAVTENPSTKHYPSLTFYNDETK